MSSSESELTKSTSSSPDALSSSGFCSSSSDWTLSISGPLCQWTRQVDVREHGITNSGFDFSVFD